MIIPSNSLSLFVDFRFVIIRKRPTLRKFLCALVVFLTEFVCIVPVIFPSLETARAHLDDGGTSGVWGIFWPLCYLIGIVCETCMINSNGIS